MTEALIVIGLWVATALVLIGSLIWEPRDRRPDPMQDVTDDLPHTYPRERMGEDA